MSVGVKEAVGHRVAMPTILVLVVLVTVVVVVVVVVVIVGVVVAGGALWGVGMRAG